MVFQKTKKNLFEDYGLFFQDYDGRNSKTCFATKVESIELPDYSSRNENLRIYKYGTSKEAMSERKVIQQIIEESILDTKDKEYHVFHFKIDFRALVFNSIIRNSLADSKNYHQEKFRMYDFQYMIRKVVQNYGADIEKQDTIRAIIDDQFYNDT